MKSRIISERLLLLTGNEAIARGAYEAGVGFAASYPGTPATEILENLCRYDGLIAEWSVNEKVALESAIGASLCGVRSLVSMKHVGLNVASDPFITFSYIGVNAGLVLVTADDPQMHSSQNEQDNRWFAKIALCPMIEPADSQEAKDFIKESFKISEEFDTPVLFRVTTRICHTKSIVELGKREYLEKKRFERNPEKYVMVPALARKRHRAILDRLKLLEEYSETAPLNRIEWGRKDIGIITSGVSYQYAKEVFPQKSFLKLGITYPLPKKMIQTFAKQVKKLVVIEELEPFLEEQIMGICKKKIYGKDFIPRYDELNPDIVREALSIHHQQSTIHRKSPNHQIENLPSRPPVLCPGCPHRAFYTTVKKLKLIVFGDIGCYTLGFLPPLNSVDFTICMGAGINASYGYEKVRKEKDCKSIGVIGDSTFFHSGITGIVNAVYNKGVNTIVILDNETTAMTGGQDHPGTGRRLQEKRKVQNIETIGTKAQRHLSASQMRQAGKGTKVFSNHQQLTTNNKENINPIKIEDIVSAIGVKRIFVVDPADTEKMETILSREINTSEPSVIIARRRCPLVFKDNWGSLSVDKERCKDCGICLQSGCPSIRKTDCGVEIDKLTCIGCGLCAKMCRFEAIG